MPDLYRTEAGVTTLDLGQVVGRYWHWEGTWTVEVRRRKPDGWQTPCIIEHGLPDAESAEARMKWHLGRRQLTLFEE